MESRGQHAHDGQRALFQVHHLADRAIRLAEVPHGEAFTHHRDGGLRPELAGSDQPAGDGLQLEDVREPGIGAVGRHELGLAAGLDRQLAAGVACRGSEGRRFGDKIGVVAAGDVSGAIGFGPQRLDGHDPAGLPVGQRLEQNGLDDAEDGRVGADPERQRQHGDDEKHRLARQDAKGKANVLQNHIRLYDTRSPWSRKMASKYFWVGRRGEDVSRM